MPAVGSGSVACHSLMTSPEAPSAEVVWAWIRPREMPQEAHAGEKKRKLGQSIRLKPQLRK